MNIQDIESAALKINTDSPAEEVFQLLETAAALKQRAKLFGEHAEQIAIDWIEANGDLQTGETRRYVGTEAVTKCPDAGRTFRDLARCAGGDEDRIVSALSANAFKPGECRSILGDELWAENFTVETRKDLKTGKPKKTLKTFDPKFAKGVPA